MSLDKPTRELLGQPRPTGPGPHGVLAPSSNVQRCRGSGQRQPPERAAPAQFPSDHERPSLANVDVARSLASRSTTDWIPGPRNRLETDAVTGLPGRHWLQRRLSAPLREGWGRGIALLDVDAFGLVNASFGPDAADHVLQQIASRLRRIPGTHAFGRWQADQFVCVVDAHRPTEALKALVESLPSITGPSFDICGDQIRVSLSCGLATSPEVPTPELFRSASSALNVAKTRGRDRIEWFDPSSQRLMAEGALRLASDLQRGIDHGELRLNLQPIVELASNEVAGVEALVRWQRPGVGLLPPEAFIDVAEQTGQIGALGAWVTYEACRVAVELASVNPTPMTVSINVSGRQLSDPGLVDMLVQALHATGCSPEAIAIEVTETALPYDISAASAVLDDIKALGVRLDLDDFGTGYASLLYLKQFPVDRLKIDGAFVRGLGSDPADTAIVDSTIRLAHSVGLTAVAEGVRTADQLSLLHEMNCDYFQGYFLSRPISLQELLHWLAEPRDSGAPSLKGPRVSAA